MKKIKPWQILTLVSALASIIINVLANALPFNGLNTGDISDRFEIYFVPAGYVFAIWLIIYIGWLVYAVYQLLPAQAENELLKKIAPWFWAASVGNIAWIFLWHYEVFTLTLVFMLLILVSLIQIYRMLVGVEGELKWFVKLPFSLHLGWISVATIANVSQLLYYLGWSGWGVAPTTWAIIMLGTAALLGLLMGWIHNDTPYNLVLIWAFIGITVSQAGAANVVSAAWIATGAAVLAAVAGMIRYKSIY